MEKNRKKKASKEKEDLNRTITTPQFQ